MKFTFTFFFLFTISIAFAQNVDSLFYYNNRNFTEIVERNNTLWILSTFGVLKFDKISKDYKYFDLDYSQQPNKNTKAIAVDNNNNLWILNKKYGLYKYDGQNWTHQDSMTNILHDDSYFGYMFVTQNDEILIGLDNGLFQYHNNQWTNLSQEVNAPSDASNITQDNNGTLWVTSGSLYSKSAGYWTKHTPQNTNIPIDSSSIRHVVMGNQNDVWFQAHRYALGRYNQNTGFETIDFPFGPGGFTNHLIDLAVRPNSDVWVAFRQLRTYFICIWDGNEMLEINPTNSPMVNNRVEKFYVDKNGSLLMFGNRGIDELQANGSWTFHDIGQSSLRTNYIRGVLSKSDGTNYIVSDEGINSFDWNTWKHLATFDYPSDIVRNEPIHICKNYKEEVAVIHQGKLYLEENDTFTVSDAQDIEPLMHTWSEVYDLEMDDSGRVWVVHKVLDIWNDPSSSSYFYLCAFKDKDSNTWEYFTSLNLGNFNVYEIAIKRDGTVWFTSSIGLVKYDYQNVVSFPFPNNEYFGNIAIDNNDDIWVSDYYEGTYFFDGQNFHLKTIDYSENMVFNSNNEMVSRYKIGQKMVDTTYIPTGYQRYGNTISICFDQNDNFFTATTQGLWIFNENGIQPINPIQKVNFPLTKPNEIPIITYPNPATDIVHIEFDIAQKGQVRADVYNIHGQYLQNAFSESFDAEKHIRPIDLSNFPNGNYYIRIKTETQQGIVKVLKIN